MEKIIVEFHRLDKKEWLKYLESFINWWDVGITVYENRLTWVKTDVYKQEKWKHRKSERYQIVRRID